MSSTQLVHEHAKDQGTYYISESAEEQSFAVLLFAHALGQWGFILSLLAMWVTWMVPMNVVGHPELSEFRKVKRRTKSFRRSMQLNRVNAPSDPTPILTTCATVTQGGRRVSFADSPARSIVAKQQPSPLATAVEQPPSPPPQETPGHESDSPDNSNLGSHSPSRFSLLQKSSRLSKLKFGFHKRRSASLDTADQSSVTSEEASPPRPASRRTTTAEPSKRSPSRFTFRRCSLPPGSERLKHKAQKRISTPTPRTMPYGPPYFATPPYQNLKRFKDELSSTCSSDSEHPRGRAIRRVNLDSHKPKCS